MIKQGRVHGKTVADGWAGAVMQKTLVIQKYLLRPYGLTDLRTDTAMCRVACPRLKVEGDQQTMTKNLPFRTMQAEVNPFSNDSDLKKKCKL